MSQVGFINLASWPYNSTKRRLMRNEILFGFVLLTFCASGGLSNPQNNGETTSIQEKMRTFLSSHCNKQNQTLEQEEYETFIHCNPTQAAMIIRNIDSHSQESDPEKRHQEISKEINSQCNAWPAKRSCQKKNFKLIEKCFDGQQKFVFYFLLALTDTICQDGDLFIEFWEQGGNKCLNEHLMKLTQEISQCLTITSTMSKDELDRNIDKITGCIGEKFANCGTNETNQVIQNLLNDIQSFYKEVKQFTADASSSSASPIYSPSPNSGITLNILISFSLFIVMSLQLAEQNLFAFMR